jgi:hypothetical protein
VDRGSVKGSAGSAPRRGFAAHVAISAVATLLLLIAITGAQRSLSPLTRGAPPWPAPPTAKTATGVRLAGLALAPAPGIVTRYALHLDVLADGDRVRVPAGVGIDWRDHKIAPLYTADGSGIVHVASDAAAPVFTLGQFFAEWQVALGADRLGGLHGSPVSVFVDGQQAGGDPAAVVLAPHQEIAVSYGNGGAERRYAFPPGV